MTYQFFPGRTPDGAYTWADGEIDDEKRLVMSIAPSLIEVTRSAAVRIEGWNYGSPQPGWVVTITQTNGAVTTVPVAVKLDATGSATFEVVGLTAGETTITATFEDVSQSVTLEVYSQDPPVIPSATGGGVVEMAVELPIAAAMRPRVQRLSHAEQIAKYPGDLFFEYQTRLLEREIVFIPKWRLK